MITKGVQVKATEFSGKVTIITGAAVGIGFEIARQWQAMELPLY